MSTTTVKTIGTTGRDYSTISAWEAACPANLTTSISGGEIWQGECYKDSTFSEHVTITGMTTNSDGYPRLTVAAGQSLFDTASNPLFYNASLGAALSIPDRYGGGVDTRANYTRVERLQINNTDNAYAYGTMRAFDGGPTNILWKDILGKVASNVNFVPQGSSALKAVNCVAICGTSATGFSSAYSPTLINCTAVVPTGTTANGTGFAGGTATLNNCASFGFTNATSGSPSSGNYNATDAASGMPGANSQHSLTYANQFVSTTVDFQLKSGSNLIAGGNTDATNAPNDIYGTARGSGTAGDVGAHEFVAGGGGTTESGALDIDGAATVSLVGAATGSAALSISGASTVNFVGAAIAAGALSSDGTSTATFVGTQAGAFAAGDLSIDGTSTVNFVGQSTASGNLSADGSSTVNFVGAATASGALSIDGVSTVNFEGFASGGVQAGELSIEGSSTVNFEGTSTGGGPVVVDNSSAAGGGAVGYHSPWGARRRKVRIQDERDLADITQWLQTEFREAA